MNRPIFIASTIVVGLVLWLEVSSLLTSSTVEYPAKEPNSIRSTQYSQQPGAVRLPRQIAAPEIVDPMVTAVVYDEPAGRDTTRDQSDSTANRQKKLNADWEELLSRSIPAENQRFEAKTAQLTATDVHLLRQLPPGCTFELLGPATDEPIVDHSGLIRPPVNAAASPKTIADRTDLDARGSSSKANLTNAQSANPARYLPSGDYKIIVPETTPRLAIDLPPTPSSNVQLNSPVATEKSDVRVAPAGYLPSQNQSTRQPISNPHAIATANNRHSTGSISLEPAVESSIDPHADVFSKTMYPSAVECAKCHQQIFDEWSSSSHAYASVSPMFHRFEDTINQLTQGTIGYFCMRCHAPVATTQGLSRDQSILNGPRVFREGVTCVACHRVRESYTKANGERRMEPGDAFAPTYGAGDGEGVALALKYKDFFRVTTDRADQLQAQPIHSRAIEFEQLAQSDYCMSCHQVAVQPGIKLEVVWDQYRASPAYRDGVTCQDCHMGNVPGVDSGYPLGPAAVVSERVVNPERKHSNHAFYGPGNSIAHPGLFPHDPAADRWTPDQWLSFDWRANWGTEEFESRSGGHDARSFPPEWQNVDDRLDAREIIESNLKKLAYKRALRRQVMQNGSKLEGPFFCNDPAVGRSLVFQYRVTNTNPGHNLPSGSLGAQPQVWLNVALIGPAGDRLWESGYLDLRGDLADLHSTDVHCGAVAFDRQLFNLQTKFLTTNLKGTDREMYLPINIDVDQLPFIRPAAQPVSVINHPPTIRMEAHSLPPLGSRMAKYTVPANLIQSPGTYRLSVRLRSRAEPIYFMEYCKSTAEMIRAMNESILDVHPYSVVFEVQ